MKAHLSGLLCFAAGTLAASSDCPVGKSFHLQRSDNQMYAVVEKYGYFSEQAYAIFNSESSASNATEFTFRISGKGNCKLALASSDDIPHAEEYHSVVVTQKGSSGELDGYNYLFFVAPGTKSDTAVPVVCSPNVGTSGSLLACTATSTASSEVKEETIVTFIGDMLVLEAPPAQSIPVNLVPA